MQPIGNTPISPSKDKPAPQSGPSEDSPAPLSGPAEDKPTPLSGPSEDKPTPQSGPSEDKPSLAEIFLREICSLLTENGVSFSVSCMGRQPLIAASGHQSPIPASGCQPLIAVPGKPVLIPYLPCARTPEEAEKAAEELNALIEHLRAPKADRAETGGVEADRAGTDRAGTDGAGTDGIETDGAGRWTSQQRPIVILHDLWCRRRAMMQERILAHCGVYTQIFARNCEVRRIDKAEAAAFMAEYHSYGNASCRYCYGLFLRKPGTSGQVAPPRETGTSERVGPLWEMSTSGRVAPLREMGTLGQVDPLREMGTDSGAMIAAAEFSNARRWIKGDRTISSYEWVRYASLPGLRISGGMGKILKAFIRDISPDDIMSYADLEWSEGKTYERLGFIQDGFKAPVLFHIDPATHLRIPAKAQDPATYPAQETWYQNLGSIKYRLKLTDY